MSKTRDDHVPSGPREAGCAHPSRGGCAGHCSSAAEKRLLATLPEDHVITTLMQEHEIIRAHLDRLEQTTRSLEGRGGALDELLESMAEAARNLIAAEPHHQREEEVLFPQMVARGIVGPPSVMLEEHEHLRRLKHAILTLATGATLHESERLSELAHTARELVRFLRDHIAKENNVLYPMAIALIRDAEDWALMKAHCDTIGYCCTRCR